MKAWLPARRSGLYHDNNALSWIWPLVLYRPSDTASPSSISVMMSMTPRYPRCEPGVLVHVFESPVLHRQREGLPYRRLPFGLPRLSPGIVLFHRALGHELAGGPLLVIAVPMPERDELVRLIELPRELVRLEKLMLRLWMIEPSGRVANGISLITFR